MANIPSALKKIQIEGARAYSAGSESLIQTLGAVINYFVDILSNPTTHNTFQFGSVVHLQTGYGIFPDFTTYTVPAGNYGILTVVPRNAGESAYVEDLSNSGWPTNCKLVSFGTGSAGQVTRMWVSPGDTIKFRSPSGQGGDYYIQLMPITAIHDYPVP
jgi:hypothetical protein